MGISELLGRRLGASHPSGWPRRSRGAFVRRRYRASMGIPTLHTSTRSSEVALPAETAWAAVASGRRGPRWYVEAAPFVLRGAIDRLVGGDGRAWDPPGTALLAPGDAAGFWRVL